MAFLGLAASIKAAWKSLVQFLGPIGLAIAGISLLATATVAIIAHFNSYAYAAKKAAEATEKFTDA